MSYLFTRGLDSINGDVTRLNLNLPEPRPEVLDDKHIPEEYRGLPCFNTLGYFKNTVNNLSKSEYIFGDNGTYIKDITNQFPIKVINLDRRPDRWTQTEATLKKAGMTNYERVSGVDGQNVPMDNNIKHLFRNNDFGFRQGFIGCALSHMNLWVRLLSSPEDYFIIMEDDIELSSDFKQKLNVTLHSVVQRPWIDLLFLGYFFWNGQPVKSDNYPEIVPLKSESYMGGFYGYIISKGAAWKMLQIIKHYGIQNGIDRFAHIHFDKMQVYQCTQHIIFSEYATPANSKDSDIQRNFRSVGEGPDLKAQISKTQTASKNLDKNFVKIKLITDWTTSANLVKQWSKLSPNGDGVWKNIQITNANDADYYVVINRPGPHIEYYDPAKTFVFHMEPWVADTEKTWGAHTWGKWAKPDPKRFKKVLTHDVHHNLGEWHLNKTYSELLNSNYANQKRKFLSAIVSDKNFDEGHIKRLEFLNFFENKTEFMFVNEQGIQKLDIDIFGRGKHDFRDYKGPLEHKDDGLIPYKYTIVVENNRETNYMTEKLYDGILAECLVFYWGAPNVGDYLPKDSYIELDLDDYEKAYETIITAIECDEWSKRLPAIREAKMKILNEMNALACFDRAIKDI